MSKADKLRVPDYARGSNHAYDDITKATQPKWNVGLTRGALPE
jgi:hypothetical protein